jgi:ABC-type nitrate/sulfonate/bicarbonate transport system substrate-binding protein
MRIKLFCSALLLIIPVAYLQPQISAAQPTRLSLKVAHASLTPSMLPLWIGIDAGFFSNSGVDVESVYIQSSPIAISALVAGEVDAVLGTSITVVRSKMAGADLVMIAAATNKIDTSIYAVPRIKSPPDLRGGKIAVSRIGGLTDMLARMAVQIMGLQQEDVTIVQVGNSQAQLLALKRNAIEAATLQVPFSEQARNQGFSLLIDLSNKGPEYQNTALITERKVLQKRRDAFKRFMEGYARSLHYFHTNKEGALKILARHVSGLDHSDLEYAYSRYRNLIPKSPFLTLRGVETAIELVKRNSKDMNVSVTDVVDQGFVSELENNGFLKRLYQ